HQLQCDQHDKAKHKEKKLTRGSAREVMCWPHSRPPNKQQRAELQYQITPNRLRTATKEDAPEKVSGNN
ncbi:MAG: hypothetical protein ABIR63_08535, partial [Sphingomicrobium sp.]